MIDLITGHQGVPHISAEQVATINNVMMYGYGQDAVVRLKDGTISMDGLEILFNEGYWRANGYDIQITEDDSVILDPTSAGMSRIDVVYAEVLQDIPSGVQRVELVVVQGTETVNPTEPPAPEAPQLTTDLLIQAVPIVKCTVSGSGMTIEDQTLPLSSGAEKAIDSMVNLLGSKNLIPYPYADTSKTIGGITFVDNGDGTVTVSGTATETAYFTVLNPNPEERTNPALKIPTNGEDFILTGCPSGAYAADIYYQLQLQEYTENSGMIGYTDYSEGVKVTPHNDPMLVRAIFITVFQGTVISEPITFKPMLRPASIIDDTWVPYSKTNRQITTDFEMVSQKDDAYSVIKAYHVGDLVTQDGAIYKCITNCSAASWEVNKTNFEKTSLTEIANELNSALIQLKNIPLATATKIGKVGNRDLYRFTTNGTVPNTITDNTASNIVVLPSNMTEVYDFSFAMANSGNNIMQNYYLSNTDYVDVYISLSDHFAKLVCAVSSRFKGNRLSFRVDYFID